MSRAVVEAALLAFVFIIVSIHRSRLGEQGFNRREQRIQLEWFLEGDEMALLYLLLRDMANGCHQDSGDCC